MSKKKKNKKKSEQKHEPQKKREEPPKHEERPPEEHPVSEKEQRKEWDANTKAIITWSITAAVAFLILLSLGLFAVFGYERLYENRIFPGVRVLDVRLDGLTASEARETLHEAVDNALKDGMRFTYENTEIALGATTIAPDDPDASKDLIRFDIDDPVDAAMSYGRSGSPIRDSFRRWLARVKPAVLDVNIFINEQEIRDAIIEEVNGDVETVNDADLEIVWDETVEKAKITINDEHEGEALLLDEAMETLRRQSEHLRFEPIKLRKDIMKPRITRADVEPLVADVPSWLEHAPFTLTYEDDEFEVTKAIFASWIGPVEKDGRVILSIDPEVFHDGIRELTELEQTAKKGTFTIEDGRVTLFEAGSTGYTIEDKPTIDGILERIGSEDTFPIVVTRVDAALSGQGPERLGIQEIIGIGRSNFAGSPANRRHNIALGVEKVNGSLIAPGEEFSLLKTLGDITAANGWLPELVIKGNKTVPEYGGGLCQIGTTTFRAALQSGMEITQRRNHSYRVSYYEPAGTDATIYEPSPDFRFRNDTEHHILIHAYIVGTEIIYEFWGTRDGREVVVAEPRIYNITAAPPTKLIESTDLSPGQKRCTESAHAGADAALDYKVTYADGSVHEETFHSHYRPWGAVCLIGVEELSDEGDGSEDASTTEETDNPSISG